MLACVLVGRPEVLWEEVFPRFQAYAATDAFLDALRPHILADELPGPATEVVQVRLPTCLSGCRDQEPLWVGYSRR